LMFDEDRPKRSWRDIDRKKDQSSHVSSDLTKKGRSRAKTATSSYKGMLDNFFEGGKAPEHVRGQLEKIEGTKKGGRRQKMLKAVRDAIGSKEVEKAVDAWISKYEDFPPDLDFLLQVLLHQDEELVRDAISRIDEMIGGRMLKRKELLIERLRRIDSLSDEDETRLRAQALRRKLR